MQSLKARLKTFPASLAIHTWDQVFELISSKQHNLPMQQHRADILLNRTFFFATLFSVLTPAWIVFEWAVLPWPLWGELGIIRLIAAALFMIIAWLTRKDHSLHLAMILMGCLLAIPAIFYVLAQPLASTYELSDLQRLDIQLYSLLPFVIAAGLSLFPLSLKEFFFFSTPLLAIIIYSSLFVTDHPIYIDFTNLWLFILILGVSLFSSLNQLRYMISQTSVASYDELTGALTRRAGIEALELQFRLANLNESNISLAFIDLDHFKSINDSFGHDAGDEALKSATHKLMETLRKGDFIIRWGGEEFVVILPGTSEESSRVVIERILHEGLGGRPDGSPLTASIGISDLSHDKARYWKELVELADERMYQAKQTGRARAIGYLEEAMTWALETKEIKPQS